MAIAHGQRIVQAGVELPAARAAMILLHGRGATAEDIMTIASEVHQPGWAYLAPQAAGNTWYPNPSGRRGRRSAWSCSASPRVPASRSSGRRGTRADTAR